LEILEGNMAWRKFRDSLSCCAVIPARARQTQFERRPALLCNTIVPATEKEGLKFSPTAFPFGGSLGLDCHGRLY
jgi:hypothetical protein